MGHITEVGEKMSRTPEITHKIMSAIKSQNTRPELALRRELWRRGLRYKKNVRALPGTPDVVFTRVQLAVFCDGDFWHGYNWLLRGYGSLEEELHRYSKPWAEKIRKNVQRDILVNQCLTEMGWSVLRIRESEIKKDVRRCANQVEYVYRNLMRNMTGEQREFYDES